MSQRLRDTPMMTHIVDKFTTVCVIIRNDPDFFIRILPIIVIKGIKGVVIWAVTRTVIYHLVISWYYKNNMDEMTAVMSSSELYSNLLIHINQIAILVALCWVSIEFMLRVLEISDED